MKTHLASLKSIFFYVLIVLSALSFQIMNAEVVKVGDIYYDIWWADNLGKGFCDVVNKDNNTVHAPEVGSYSGNVEIPSSITYDEKSYEVVSVYNYAFANSTNLESVTLPSSVERICDFAFSGCM